MAKSSIYKMLISFRFNFVTIKFFNRKLNLEMQERDTFSLKDKVIVVTGATGVLGHAFIKALSSAGAKVGVLGRNVVVANERVKEIEKNGGTAIALIADVQDESSLESLLRKNHQSIWKNRWACQCCRWKCP
jgi:FlaA1/EpsC-like NDP-sugar epimerase